MVMSKTPRQQGVTALAKCETFRIFRDWNGMYRWTLTDDRGRRVQASRFGFAAPAGAFRDIETLRTEDRYATAIVRDETGR
jgi:hypothetical protein